MRQQMRKNWSHKSAADWSVEEAWPVSPGHVWHEAGVKYEMGIEDFIRKLKVRVVYKTEERRRNLEMHKSGRTGGAGPNT